MVGSLMLTVVMLREGETFKNGGLMVSLWGPS
jgi:hypothetical protein